MRHEGEKVYMEMFLKKKNMTFEQCSANQKKVFNDWPPAMWDMYDWGFLSDKKVENDTK